MDILFITNDDGNYYIPSLGIDLIGDWELAKGYQVLTEGSNNISER